MLHASLFLAATVTACGAPAADGATDPEAAVRVVRVVDGDTIRVQLRGREAVVR